MKNICAWCGAESLIMIIDDEEELYLCDDCYQDFCSKLNFKDSE